VLMSSVGKRIVVVGGVVVGIASEVRIRRCRNKVESVISAEGLTRTRSWSQGREGQDASIADSGAVRSTRLIVVERRRSQPAQRAVERRCGAIVRAGSGRRAGSRIASAFR